MSYAVGHSDPFVTNGRVQNIEKLPGAKDRTFVIHVSLNNATVEMLNFDVNVEEKRLDQDIVA